MLPAVPSPCVSSQITSFGVAQLGALAAIVARACATGSDEAASAPAQTSTAAQTFTATLGRPEEMVDRCMTCPFRLTWIPADLMPKHRPVAASAHRPGGLSRRKARRRQAPGERASASP